MSTPHLVQSTADGMVYFQFHWLQKMPVILNNFRLFVALKLKLLSSVRKVEKKLATEYLQNELSYTLHQNQRYRGNHYRKIKAFYSLHILQTDLLTLGEIQRHYNSSYQYILIAISVFIGYAYAVTLRSKRGDDAARALESIFGEYFYRKI